MTTEFMKYDSTTDQLHLQIASKSVQDVRSTTYRMQVDEDNIPTFDDYHLIGSKLYHNEELVVKDVDENYIIKTILDNAVERVYYIEIEGETIYNGR